MAYFPYSFWHSSLSRDLIAYYKLNGNGNDSLNKYNLINNGTPVFSAGKIGNALSSTTDSNYLYLPTHQDFQLTRNKTFAFWFKSNTDQQEYLIRKDDQSQTAAIDEYLFYKGVDNPFAIQFYVYCDNNTVTSSVVSSLSASLGSWNFVIAWVDMDNSLIWVSLNNETPVSEPLGGTPDLGVLDFIIGGSLTGNPADNMIDEVGIWNRILTTAERNKLWNNGKGLSFPF